MTTIFAGILMLGVLVFVHELGHFAVAKFTGVKVLRFSLGFGPRIVGRTWGKRSIRSALYLWADMYRCSGKALERKVKAWS